MPLRQERLLSDLGLRHLAYSELQESMHHSTLHLEKFCRKLP